MTISVVAKSGFLLAFLLMLGGCSADKSVLKDFQNTDHAKEVTQCAGVDGQVDWDIFKNPEIKNDKVRVIQAIITKKASKFTLQWKINTETKVTELAFAAPDNKKQNNILAGTIEFATFCMKK